MRPSATCMQTLLLQEHIWTQCRGRRLIAAALTLRSPMTQPCCESEQPLAFDGVDERDFAWRCSAEVHAGDVHHGNNRLGIGIIEVAEESIGIASDQAEGRESLGWEMLQIEGQDGRCPAFDR